MNKKKATGTRLFFTEFLIVLFFFLIVSTVCLKVFVHSYEITQKSEALSKGQMLAASIAEVLEHRIDQGFTESEKNIPLQLSTALQDIWPEGTVSSNQFILSLNKDFTPCIAEEMYYTASVSLEPVSSEQFAYTDDAYPAENISAQIIISSKKEELIYNLSIFLHIPATYKEVLS